MIDDLWLDCPIILSEGSVLQSMNSWKSAIIKNLRRVGQSPIPIRVNLQGKVRRTISKLSICFQF